MAPARCFISACLSLAAVASGSAASQARNFRGRGEASTVDNVEQSLRSLLEAAHIGGNSPVARRLLRIEASIASTFQALPKNDFGRLPPRSVRYIVHNYFAKEHGWQIKGLEPQGMRTNVSDVHQTSILQDRSPALVESLVEAYQGDRGLALTDVAAMAAMLERLVIDESITLLHAAYFLNGLSASDEIEHLELDEILRSYLLLFEMGLRGNLTDAETHQEIKRRVAAMGAGWPTLVEFENEAVMSFDFQTKDVTNPFVEQAFTFEESALIVDDLAQRYGKWQNHECTKMKEDLIDMDEDGSGMIPLSTFYTQSTKRAYQFTESVDYLRQIGALDETWRHEPRVRVSNYVGGPSNCIAASNYYSVCCLNECDGVLNELEASIRAPAASPERILHSVRNITSSSMDVPKNITKDLIAKLQSIAERNDGEVPLHGRLFAQWLHLVFPYECQFPHISEEGIELSAHHWLGGKAIASEEQRTNHVESVSAKEADEGTADPRPTEVQWSDEEVLPLLETPRPALAVFGIPVRVVVQVAMFLVVLRMVLTSCFAAANFNGSATSKKGTKGMLPI